MDITKQAKKVGRKISHSLLLKVIISVSAFSFILIVCNLIGISIISKQVLGEYFGNQLREKIHSQHVIGENALMTLNSFVAMMPAVYPELGERIAQEDFDYVVNVAKSSDSMMANDGYLIADADGNIKYYSYGTEPTEEQMVRFHEFTDWLKQKEDLTYNGYLDVLDQGVSVVSAHALPDMSTMQVKAIFLVVQLRLSDCDYLKRTGDMLQISGTVYKGKKLIGSSLLAGQGDVESMNIEIPQTWISDSIYQTKQPVVAIDETEAGTFISAYAPIPDYRNDVIGIYNAAIDISVMKEIITIMILTLIIIALVVGGLLLWGIVKYFQKNMVNPIQSLTQTAQRIAQGDLTEQIRIATTHDEIEQLSIGVKDMQKSLAENISGLTRTANFLHAASEGLSRASLQLSDGANKQAASLEEVSSALEQMAGNIHQNKDNATMTEKQMEQADKAVQQIANEATDSMNDTRKIATSIKAINDLVGQTNILSLNASVEAARAGNMGKGFGVVAKEVGRLAEQTKNTALDISEKANKSIIGTQNINTLLDEVTPQLHRVSELVKEIAVASQEQSIGADQINLAIADLNRVTQESAANAEEIAANAQELSSTSDKMKQIVGKFKL